MECLFLFLFIQNDWCDVQDTNRLPPETPQNFVKLKYAPICGESNSKSVNMSHLQDVYFTV